MLSHHSLLGNIVGQTDQPALKVRQNVKKKGLVRFNGWPKIEDQWVQIERDGLIQTRINSLSLSGGNLITGLIKVAGKRKLESEVNNTNGGKLKRL